MGDLVGKMIMIMASVLMIVLLMILMSMTSNLFWYVVEAKEDVECGEIPDQAALCTFPVENDHPNVDKKKILMTKISAHPLLKMIIPMLTTKTMRTTLLREGSCTCKTISF